MNAPNVNQYAADQPPLAGWIRFECKTCKRERRRAECLHCGNVEPITDEPRVPGWVK